MDVEIGLPGQARQEVGRILNRLLADEHVLYVKTRNYHWNLVGPRFHSMHVFFEEQYVMLQPVMDDIAERARSVGATALGSMAEFTEHARLREEAGGHPETDAMLRSLLADHEAMAQQLRKDVDRCDEELNDQGTADFLTGLMEMHEKQAWMLRAHLEPAG
jgi:starvation-inducible DNA-binding protein